MHVNYGIGSDWESSRFRITAFNATKYDVTFATKGGSNSSPRLRHWVWCI